MIAYYNRVDFPPPADHQADLSVDITGKKTKLPGQFRGNDLFRRNAFTIQAFQLFDLTGTKTSCISRKFIDGGILSLLKLIRADYFIHFV
jgi:hypothetical protein